MYKVIVGASTSLSGALFSLESEVRMSIAEGWAVSGGVNLTTAHPRTVSGFEMRDGVVFIYSQGMVKHEADRH
jgi:hypothetical protein